MEAAKPPAQPASSAPAGLTYPLSTNCPICARRAWRVFGAALGGSQHKAPYRCPENHIAWRGPRRERGTRDAA